MTERQRPYGWGCQWHGGYCFRYGQTHESACLKCHRVIGQEEEGMWREYLSTRLKHRNGEITDEEFKAFMVEKTADYHSSVTKVIEDD